MEKYDNPCMGCSYESDCDDCGRYRGCKLYAKWINLNWRLFNSFCIKAKKGKKKEVWVYQTPYLSSGSKSNGESREDDVLERT